MKYCKLCLQPNTRPKENFTVKGLCFSCINYNNNKELDYASRYHILQKIVSKYKRKPGKFFDCIIGVSGGKDSTRQALWVRDKLGLKPLLVSLVYPPQQVNNIGAYNMSNLINLGFDVLISSPAPLIWQKLVREAFLRFANWCRATEMALYSSVPQIALKNKIQLIFIGENQSFRDQKTIGSKGWQYNNLISQNTLNGGDIEWMLETGIDNKFLLPYHYPSLEEINNGGLEIVDLGWFIGDWDNLTNAKASSARGIKIRTDSVANTGDPMGVSALDEDWVTLNQMIKYYKFGFGKVTDYVNEDIRLGRIKRNNGIELINKYDGKCADIYIESFCDYIKISVQEFWDVVRNNVNKNLFDIKENGNIVPKFKVGSGL
jgi:N-acetyl sugar amidotransferase